MATKPALYGPDQSLKSNNLAGHPPDTKVALYTFHTK